MFNKFLKQKEDILKRTDKSNKGSIDKKILKIVNTINKLDDFYTTSSCSGRIMVVYFPNSEKKCDIKTIFSSHDKTNYKNILKAIINENSKEKEIWFKVEPFILHVYCKDQKSANILFRKIRKAGIKKFGGIESKKGIIVEITGTDFIQTPLPPEILDWEKNTLEQYIKKLVEFSNKKMDKNLEKIKRLETSFKELKS